MSPAFNYTTGNPNNLVGGLGANMADIQGSFTDLRTFLNGNIDGTNAPSLETTFSTWKPVMTRGGHLLALPSSTYLIPMNGSVFGLTSASGGAQNAFYLDPADFVAGARTTNMRIVWTLLTNGVSTATSFSTGLSLVTSTAGNSGVAPSITGSAASITNSSVTFTTPGTNVRTTTASASFGAPAAGFYIMTITAGGGMAANSAASVIGQLQYQQV